MKKGVGKDVDLFNVKYIVDYLKDLLYDRYIEVGKRFFKILIEKSMILPKKIKICEKVLTFYLFCSII